MADVGCGARAASTSRRIMGLEGNGVLPKVDIDASCGIGPLFFTRFTGAATLALTRSSLNLVILTSAENVSAVVAMTSGPNDEVREIVL